MPLADMRRRAPKIWRSMVIACSVLLVATACTQFGRPRAIPEPIGRPLPYIEPAAWDAKGTIVSSEPLVLAGADPEALASIGDARKAVYRSVSAYNGQGTEVSGTFFVPKGDPPEG